MKWISLAVFFSLVFPVSAFALVPNDTHYSNLWYLPHISADQAWDTETGSSDIIVAVLDAGIDLDHPDLAENIWKNQNEIPNNGIDDDLNGFVDDYNGWDFVDNDSSPVPSINASSLTEAISHGSVIAGIIGAVGNNNEGLTGINWHVRIMSVRMLNNIGVGDSASTAHAVDYAVANGADVINLSFSGDTMDTALRDSLKRAYQAGVVTVAAMGNEGEDSDITPVYPACFGALASEDWVIGVASTTKTDEKSSFSNYGSSCVDLSAPGENFYGISYNDPAIGLVDAYGNSWSGTSMAAPVVSGTVALILSHYPDITPANIRNILKLSVDPVVLTQELSGKMGAGRVNVARALEYASIYASVNKSSVSQTSYITGITFPAVYAVDANENRLAFADALTYFTYESSFIQVEVIDDVRLSDYPLSGIVLPKAGVVLVKIQSDPRVYALEENPANAFTPILREITSEEIAQSMYGTNWADYVIDISPSFFTKFTTGAKIYSPEIVDTSIMKTRQELSRLANS